MTSIAGELAVLLEHLPGSGPTRSSAAPGTPVVLADRPDGTVVGLGDRVAKAHEAASDPYALDTRLRAAAHPLFAGILLAPLDAPPRAPAGSRVPLTGRPVSLWPRGEPVSPDDPDAAPWEATARLLARLHAVRPGKLPFPLPPMRGPHKAARAVDRMRAAPGVRPSARSAVERAWSGLPHWARDEAPPRCRDAVCHGDMHLGQLVRHPAPGGPWLLIDVDDLGAGDPAWDLARPAAWFATGLLDPHVWARFLGAYRAAGGRAVAAEGDPWPQLDVPARALTVQSAAVALAKAAAEAREPDDAEQALIEACSRMSADVNLPPEPAHRAP
ncbi:phosphotransferase enzyme family protein [Streptomyces meridianus]|uniref:Aminoglycoside phosphotransferase family protein n=1 Tax=Streptomyces meridianus TaxID=2938945 RepID=A0ABT0X459_9ACTN|nr:aminoglycoside phosphotransferase family protein [Streptomyces meridianus]MCM2577110.1 aminoglycoside phosphotransferase family protein [Streptomyces meridianus]